MAGRKLAIAGLAALIGLGLAGCGRRYALPQNPTNCQYYIEEDVAGAERRYYHGMEEGGNALYDRRGRQEKVFWDQDSNGNVDVYAVQNYSLFLRRTNTTTFMNNPGAAYTRAYSDKRKGLLSASRNRARQ